VHGVSFPGNLFFDPLASGLVTPAGLRGSESEGSAAATPRRRATQTAAEQKALRAASLLKVSRDLERMVRERTR
jgi:aryl-alcohol dehydrogenase-like predicted oxidoreductase